MSTERTKNTKQRVKLEGTDKTEGGVLRSDIAAAMLARGEREIFLETDELPYAPQAVAVLSASGLLLGYLPTAAAQAIYREVAETEEDARAMLVSANEGTTEIEFDTDDFDEFEEPENAPVATKDDGKASKNHAAKFALIAVVAFYLAYRMFTKAG